jgi:hypothetical protein
LSSGVFIKELAHGGPLAIPNRQIVFVALLWLLLFLLEVLWGNLLKLSPEMSIFIFIL